VERVRSAATTVAEVGQNVDGVPVVDARWTLIFDRHGYLTHVTGAPFDPARLTVPVRPALDADRAIVLALEHDSLTPADVAARARLVIEGRTNRLVWVVDLKGRRRPADSCSIRVDAHLGRVVGRPIAATTRSSRSRSPTTAILAGSMTAPAASRLTASTSTPR
jgi:Zn-dependent metalloprotease